jgi:predicted enzyme related to lactoylglutathione lyase
MPAPVVFFDIAGPDLKRQAEFYRAVFDWDITDDGRFSVPAPARLPATLRADPAETLIYVGVEDVTATLARIEAHGGATVFPRLAVPGVVVLGMFTDPAGNKAGLVELEGGVPKIP